MVFEECFTMPEFVLDISITAIALGAFVLAYFLYCAHIIKKIMRPKKRDNDFLVQYEVKEKNYDVRWLDIPFEEKWLDSQFGYRLFGRLYKCETSSNKFMIDLHGHNSSSISQLKYLKLFRDMGYNVFIPDHRRSGLSGGDSVTFGHYEKYDVISWLDLLEKENPGAVFAMFGESMGAATAILVTARDARIKFLIEYCGFANFEELALPYAKKRSIYKFMEPGFKLAAGALYKVKFAETDALSAIKKITVPVLIMHSKKDSVVYVNNAYKLAEAQPNAKTVFFEESKHARSIVEYPKEYEQAVKSFILESEQKQNIN